jgi:hypothetical protein
MLQPVPPAEAYFLQDLVLFTYGSKVMSPKQIKAEMDQIIRQMGGSREEVISKLQEQADRLHHGINVSAVLALAQA